eukprot:TRINITY_DN29665_c0_g2_i1.p1 TRINITY_DN29665_c0_g2~~TRINITY_DN29665_c0_g2_i1.p1  ORF type:complete len:643 (+),score=114.59 TRINITY_DN29665_c0_g2_i1:68-1996(+)
MVKVVGSFTLVALGWVCVFELQGCANVDDVSEDNDSNTTTGSPVPVGISAELYSSAPDPVEDDNNFNATLGSQNPVGVSAELSSSAQGLVDDCHNKLKLAHTKEVDLDVFLRGADEEWKPGEKFAYGLLIDAHYTANNAQMIAEEACGKIPTDVLTHEKLNCPILSAIRGLQQSYYMVVLRMYKGLRIRGDSREELDGYITPGEALGKLERLNTQANAACNTATMPVPSSQYSWLTTFEGFMRKWGPFVLKVSKLAIRHWAAQEGAYEWLKQEGLQKRIDLLSRAAKNVSKLWSSFKKKDQRFLEQAKKYMRIARQADDNVTSLKMKVTKAQKRLDNAKSILNKARIVERGDEVKDLKAEAEAHASEAAEEDADAAATETSAAAVEADGEAVAADTIATAADVEEEADVGAEVAADAAAAVECGLNPVADAAAGVCTANLAAATAATAVATAAEVIADAAAEAADAAAAAAKIAKEAAEVTAGLKEQAANVARADEAKQRGFVETCEKAVTLADKILKGFQKSLEVAGKVADKAQDAADAAAAVSKEVDHVVQQVEPYEILLNGTLTVMKQFLEEAKKGMDDVVKEGCTKGTGGSCEFLSCDVSRNATCKEGFCVCGDGLCAVGGRCIWIGITTDTTTPSPR